MTDPIDLAALRALGCDAVERIAGALIEARTQLAAEKAARERADTRLKKIADDLSVERAEVVRLRRDASCLQQKCGHPWRRVKEIYVGLTYECMECRALEAEARAQALEARLKVVLELCDKWPVYLCMRQVERAARGEGGS